MFLQISKEQARSLVSICLFFNFSFFSIPFKLTYRAFLLVFIYNIFLDYSSYFFIIYFFKLQKQLQEQKEHRIYFFTDSPPTPFSTKTHAY